MKGRTLTETVTWSFSWEEFANWCLEECCEDQTSDPLCFWPEWLLGFHVINLPEKYTTHSSEFYNFWISDSSHQTSKNYCLF